MEQMKVNDDNCAVNEMIFYSSQVKVDDRLVLGPSNEFCTTFQLMFNSIILNSIN